MKKLDSSAWKNFTIKDLFEVSNSKGINANQVDFNGSTPYISRTDKNNGVVGYIDEDETKLNPGNTISFGQDTWTLFYQEKPYFTGNRVKVLSLKNYELNENIALFLIVCLKKIFSSFSWGANSKEIDFNNRIISLPVNCKNEPDWEFIDGFIKDYREQVSNKITDLNSIVNNK